ncbi:MAG: hypothetical protein IPK85_13050 [Gemmatimonadetes bacterium]|nr:hypothetical protein [Gemmatimonadota bacterium]
MTSALARGVVLACLVAPVLQAQAPRAQRPWRLLARVDAVAATHGALQAGVGVSLPSGTYLRTELTAAAGGTWWDDGVRLGGRVDAVARFVIDPFAESLRAVHAVGGVSAMHDGREWQPRLMVGLGVEGRRRGPVRWSTEVVVGGGVRVGVVARRTRPSRR